MNAGHLPPRATPCDKITSSLYSALNIGVIEGIFGVSTSLLPNFLLGVASRNHPKASKLHLILDRVPYNISIVTQEGLALDNEQKREV